MRQQEDGNETGQEIACGKGSDHPTNVTRHPEVFSDLRQYLHLLPHVLLDEDCGINIQRAAVLTKQLEIRRCNTEVSAFDNLGTVPFSIAVNVSVTCCLAQRSLDD